MPVTVTGLRSGMVIVPRQIAVRPGCAADLHRAEATVEELS